MNDDFLYTRQENPAPEFVAKLEEELQRLEAPQKAKRKNGQRRFNWKAIAAVMSVVLVGIFGWYTPEIQIPIMTMINGYPNEDLLRDAQETMGFVLPETPNGYYLSMIHQQEMDMAPYIFVNWQTYRGYCVISFFVFDNPESSEMLQQNQEYNRHLAESFNWVDMVELRNGVEAVWRSTTYNGQPFGVNLEWNFDGNHYKLDSTPECATKEVLATIAQSTLPEER